MIDPKSSRPPAPTEAAEAVGKYRLLRKLGEGGMGVVYQALDTRLQRSVALKFLSAASSGDERAAERQLREARAAAALNHPNVATVYEIGRAEPGRYIAMEYVEGERLRDRIRREPVPRETALDWALQLCDAIAAAHDLGILHRDIKSTNVMIARDDRVKVLDFGVALRPRDSTRLTDLDAIVGTVDYLAPELLEGRRSSPASDVFSLGVVLYELFGRRHPFRAESPAQVMYRILHVDPEPLTELRADVSAELAGIVGHALAKDPAERYGNARELLAPLRTTALAQTDPETPTATAPPGARTVPGNLPASTTTFVGRDEELLALENRLDESRLLTLTGPGGAGKTRASLELAKRNRHKFPMGVFLVELAALGEGAQIVRAIAKALGVREESGRDLVDSVVEHLAARKDVLLILDNCEHLVDASASIARALLEAVPELKIVASSQERLGLPGENVWQISGLTLPPAQEKRLERLAGCEAVQLFVARAQQAKPGFELTPKNAADVGRICRRLDGIPLAIELAAARIALLTVAQLLDRLEDRFRLLTGGSRTALPRQQTLRAMVEWSLDLLTANERRLFLRLSVFSDGMSLEAVEQVCSADCDEDLLELLGRLVDKSLVLARDRGGECRYHLLETLREYGAAGLVESGEGAAVRARHAAFYADLAHEAEPELIGPEQARWFERLDAEAGNVEAAIRWLLAAGSAEEALSVAAAIARFWFVRGYLGTGRELLGLALEANPAPTALRARALHGKGILANDQGDYAAARRCFEESLEIRRSLDDPAGVAATLSSLGVAARDVGDYAGARALLEEGLAIHRRAADRPGIATSLHALGITAHREGDCGAARALFEEGLAIRKELGDRRGIAALLAHLGSVAHDRGDWDEARAKLDESLEIFRELENKRGTAFALGSLGGVETGVGDWEAAWVSHVQALTVARQLGDKRLLVQSVEWLARLAAARGHHARALEIDGAAGAVRERLRFPRTPMERSSLRGGLAPAEAALGDEAAARLRAVGSAHDLDTAISRALERS